MTGLLTIRDAIRDFLRKFDEVTTPIFRFICSFIMFACINSLFGYSEFLHRGIITFLLSVICALVSTPVAVFIAGIVITVNCFSVSVDIGVLFLLLFIIIYCSYMRLFPESGFVLALVPILYLWKIPFAAPVIVAILAGFSGAVPAAFGVVLYYFSKYTAEAYDTIRLGEDTDFQGYAYIVNGLMKDKDMLLAVIVFAVVVMITALVYRLRFDYAWYVAIAVGAVCTILLFMVCGMAVETSVSMGSLVLGSLLGGLIGLVVQICKSVVDYSRKETVQFEDDDYYYYVKAIPKFNMAQNRKSVKKITEENGKKPMQQDNTQKTARTTSGNGGYGSRSGQERR